MLQCCVLLSWCTKVRAVLTSWLTIMGFDLGLALYHHLSTYLFIFDLHGAIYRVAWIKIPHRTKCNFATTVRDFYIQISWNIWERSCYNSEVKKNISVFSKVMAPPFPPLGHIWDVMLVWRKGNINKNWLRVTVLCTVIMVHKDMSSYYRLVDCIGLWSCVV